MIDEQQVEELRARMARVVIRDDPAWMAEEARPLLLRWLQPRFGCGLHCWHRRDYSLGKSA